MPNTPEYKKATMLAVQKAKEEMTNSSVKDMQEKLRYYYPELKVDGLYGKNTIAAIKGFENMMKKEPMSVQEQIDKACRFAAAKEFIENLPQSYQTVIGEGSGRLY